jgi:glycosyltransferase involved in cell wall biosynthesis
MMEIWLAPSAFFPHRGGVEELTLQLAKELRARGHRVLVLANQYPSSLDRHETVEGVDVHRLPFTAPTARPREAARFLWSQPSVQRSLDTFAPRPDIVHVQCPSVQTAPLLAYAKRHRIPFVLTSQGEVVMDANRLYERSLYMRLTFRFASRSAAALTACSAWTAAQCRLFSPRFATATVIPNGVDPSEWDIGPPTESPVLCAWGRHVPQKGFDLAIRAFAILRMRVGDARLLIGGEGPDTLKLREIAGKGVEFVGPLDRSGVRELLAASRVAVVPSRIEPFGIVALEALAAGRGLVYASNTGLAEAAGELGRPADVRDPSALANAMEAEILLPAEAAAGRDRGRQFSWSRICEHYLDVYRNTHQR